MRVPYAVVSRRLIFRLFLYSRFQEFSRVFSALFFINFVTLFKRLVYLDKSRTGFVEYHHYEEQVYIVVIILVYLFVVNADVRAS